MLNKRQDQILSLFDQKKTLSISEIMGKFPNVTKPTINRDLILLLKQKLITKHGKARATTYSISKQRQLLQFIDPEEYFKTSVDKRSGKNSFDFDLISILQNPFTQNEIEHLNKLTKNYQQNIKSLSTTLQKKEFERLTIDFSWKSSQIEGNTYTLLETERLLKEQKASAGRSKEETNMILNHKIALDYIRQHSQQFSKLSISLIENIHALATKTLGIKKGLRSRAVGITGTTYKPLDNPYQIEEALVLLLSKINKEKNIFSKALSVLAFLAYIQPFEDGNKRTSRLVANAVLLSNGACPLSYRSVDELEYKKAMILLYEQGSLTYLKQLFMEQYEFAVKNYFL